MDVHNKASNMASRAELGNYATIIDINKKILNYLSYLQDKDAGQFYSETILIYKYQLSFTTVVKIVSTQI